MKVIKTAQRMGIAVRIEGSSDTVQKYKDLGVKHFCTGGDMPALWDFFKTDGAKINKTLQREPPACTPFGIHRGGLDPAAKAMCVPRAHSLQLEQSRGWSPFFPYSGTTVASG